MILKFMVTRVKHAMVRVSQAHTQTRTGEQKMRKPQPLDTLVRPAPAPGAKLVRTGAGVHRKARRDRANTNRKAIQEAQRAWH